MILEEIELTEEQLQRIIARENDLDGLENNFLIDNKTTWIDFYRGESLDDIG